MSLYRLVDDTAWRQRGTELAASTRNLVQYWSPSKLAWGSVLPENTSCLSSAWWQKGTELLSGTQDLLQSLKPLKLSYRDVLPGICTTWRAHDVDVNFSTETSTHALVAKHFATAAAKAAQVSLAFSTAAPSWWGQFGQWYSMGEDRQQKMIDIDDRSKRVELNGAAYRVVYDPCGGPANMGSLLIAAQGPEAVTPHHLQEFFAVVYGLAQGQDKTVIQKDIVAIFDISNMVWPSMTSAPAIVRVLRNHGSPPQELQDRTQAFAVIKGNSLWFCSALDTVLAIAQPATIPIFATSQSAAEELLVARLGR